jgi:hypothetical protein
MLDRIVQKELCGDLDRKQSVRLLSNIEIEILLHDKKKIIILEPI